MCCGKEIPAQGIGAIVSHYFNRVDHIAPALAHFLTLDIQNQLQANTVFKDRPVKKQCRDGVQTVEPAASLVNCLANKVGLAYLVVEKLPVFLRIMQLGKRHGTGIKPAVHYLGGALHFSATFFTGEVDLIHVGTVQVQRLSQSGKASFAFQFINTTNTFQAAAFLTAPYR